MTAKWWGVFLGSTVLSFPNPAAAQQVDCQRLLSALTNSPPGVYSPAQAQDMAAVYNRECLNMSDSQQQQYQQQYNQQQQQNSDAEALGQALGQIFGGMIRR